MLVKQLFGQALPLVVFIVVDSFFDNITVSIVSSVAFAAAQLVFYYVKSHRIDWFVVLDVALIAGLGAVSIALKNEIFFKVKPALVEAVIVVFFFVLLFLPEKFLLSYFGRMMPANLRFNPRAVHAMKIMLLVLCSFMTIHIGAVLYTAYGASRKTWAFVSGPGFYLMFVPMMGWAGYKRIKIKRSGF
jgi:intracellular septation protein A